MWAKILAFLMPIAESEFTALAPIAVTAAAQLGSEEIQAVQSGDLKHTGKILATVVQQTGEAAAAAGIQAGAPALLAAAGHAIASLPAK